MLIINIVFRMFRRFRIARRKQFALDMRVHSGSNMNGN